MNVLYIDLDVPEDAPPVVREGAVRRRLVTLTGVCPCGARFSMPSRAERRAAARSGAVLTARVEHEDECPAIAPELDSWLAGGAS